MLDHRSCAGVLYEGWVPLPEEGGAVVAVWGASDPLQLSRWASFHRFRLPFQKGVHSTTRDKVRKSTYQGGL